LAYLNKLGTINIIKNYFNPIEDRNYKRIFNDNNNKSGIYMLTNKINNKCYIGSAVDLNKRIFRYFQKSYLSKNEKLLIVKAINKYGINNFCISILEYTTSLVSDLLQREQYWLDRIQPEYNILKLAGNSLGYKHSEIAKFIIAHKKLGIKREEKVKDRISESLKISKFVGHKHSIETKRKLKIIASSRKSDPNEGLFISVEDISTGTIKIINQLEKQLKI
jgi:group I intron endonuclease